MNGEKTRSTNPKKMEKNAVCFDAWLLTQIICIQAGWLWKVLMMSGMASMVYLSLSHCDFMHKGHDSRFFRLCIVSWIKTPKHRWSLKHFGVHSS